MRKAIGMMLPVIAVTFTSSIAVSALAQPAEVVSADDFLKSVKSFAGKFPSEVLDSDLRRYVFSHVRKSPPSNYEYDDVSKSIKLWKAHIGNGTAMVYVNCRDTGTGVGTTAGGARVPFVKRHCIFVEVLDQALKTPRNSSDRMQNRFVVAGAPELYRELVRDGVRIEFDLTLQKIPNQQVTLEERSVTNQAANKKC